MKCLMIAVCLLSASIFGATVDVARGTRIHVPAGETMKIEPGRVFIGDVLVEKVMNLIYSIMDVCCFFLHLFPCFQVRPEQNCQALCSHQMPYSLIQTMRTV